MLQSSLPALWHLHCNLTSPPAQSCFFSLSSQGLSLTHILHGDLYLSICFQRTWPAVTVTGQQPSSFPRKGTELSEGSVFCSVWSLVLRVIPNNLQYLRESSERYDLRYKTKVDNLEVLSSEQRVETTSNLNGLLSLQKKQKKQNHNKNVYLESFWHMKSL